MVRDYVRELQGVFDGMGGQDSLFLIKYELMYAVQDTILLQELREIATVLGL